MLRKLLSNREVIYVILCLQLVPLLIFPASSYSPTTQEWWLPILLSFLVIVALVQLIFRKSQATWPWYLLAFSQGFNIISRLMMLLSHTVRNDEGVQVFNADYVIIAAVAMVLSAFEIWYFDLPEVRNRLLN
jgi:succinate dehydrogenase hydrophobic anchor subunit